MQQKLLYFTIFLVGSLSYGQFACPTPTGPTNGDTNIAVDSVITWNAIEGVSSYLISVGTRPGGTDIAEQSSTGSSTSFRPVVGLPEETDIYVTLSLFFFDRPNIECSEFSFRTEDVTDPPDCTTPQFPVEGLTDVDVGTTISWNYAPKATGYRLTLGTSADAKDILDGEEIVRAVLYDPTNDLPPDTEIFAQIVPYNENGTAIGPCSVFRFRTRVPEVLPSCSRLISPANGAVDVSLNPVLEWGPVPEAAGYKVSIGSSPTQNNILDNAIFGAISTPVIEFEPNTTFFATVIPFNSAGDAIGCSQTSFSTTTGCAPFMDEAMGELVSIAPTIDFPQTLTLCRNELPYTISSNEVVEGYRWFKITSDGSEIMLSNSAEVTLSEEGDYRYEAYNTIVLSDDTLECASTQEFKVVTSELPIISRLVITGQNGQITITVQTESIGDYEYALNAEDGPYQDSNIFNYLSIATHTLYLRDRNGCGIVSEKFVPDLSVEGFPRFFTPNGDGINDFWQFIPPTDTENNDVGTIFIFDRYGNLLGQIESSGMGWDGTFIGKSMPASDYWFRAIAQNGKDFKGHFTLKR